MKPKKNDEKKENRRKHVEKYKETQEKTKKTRRGKTVLNQAYSDRYEPSESTRAVTRSRFLLGISMDDIQP